MIRPIGASILLVSPTDAEEGSPVEIEEVEDLVHERPDRRRATASGRAGPSLADPLLEEGEVEPAVLVERDHLAVDDRLLRVDP